MNTQQIKEIANAVLYEGYLLYPYRHSAIKNRQRWNFGVVYPKEYSEANGNLEPWSMQTECLITGSAATMLDITVRFLHLLVRSVVQSGTASTSTAFTNGREDSNLTSATLASRLANEPWEEGVEREVATLGLTLGGLAQQPQLVPITFPAAHMEEASAERATDTIVRDQQAIAGSLIIAAEQVKDNVFKLSIHIENRTPHTASVPNRHNAILQQSFVSTHTILQAHEGAFVSLMDPPQEVTSLAQTCKNIRTWPVLVGQEGEYDAMLSSPIILYDYPKIAPESPGSLFDGTEIDEILTLRIMTLTDEEKQEMRQGDQRVREILERTEAITPEQFMKMHGTIRSLQPANAPSAQTAGDEFPTITSSPDYPGEDYPPPAVVRIADKEVRAGDKVRLHPKRRADAFDMMLDGKTARVEVIQQDFENRIYLVVTIDDDPGREQWDERVLPGHRFYFFPEEIEPLEHTYGGTQ